MSELLIRGLLAGGMIAVAAALLGVPLVLRKRSMLPDGLSHAAFAAMAIAMVAGFAPVWVALLLTAAGSFIVLRMGQKSYGDAAVAVLSAASLAVGTMLASIFNLDLDHEIEELLFGDIATVSWVDVGLSVLAAVLAIVLYIVAKNRILAITFDEEFARAVGVRTRLYDGLFALICSVVVVAGMRLVGALLVASLIIFPALSAMKIAKTFRGVVIAAVATSVAMLVIGLGLSEILNTPAGATVVIVNLIWWILLGSNQ